MLSTSVKPREIADWKGIQDFCRAAETQFAADDLDNRKWRSVR
jgi:hypothetical protein